jgi:hypothetical protein
MQIADMVVAIARAFRLAPAGDEVETGLAIGRQPRQSLRIAAQRQRKPPARSTRVAMGG